MTTGGFGEKGFGETTVEGVRRDDGGETTGLSTFLAFGEKGFGETTVDDWPTTVQLPGFRRVRLLEGVPGFLWNSWLSEAGGLEFG
jgi:hypothetical protein